MMCCDLKCTLLFVNFYLQKQTNQNKGQRRGRMVDTWMGPEAASSELSFHCEFHEFLLLSFCG